MMFTFEIFGDRPGRGLISAGREGRAALFGVWLAAVALKGLGAASLPPPSSRPNLLLITVDTLRADRLGCYGSEAPATPNIDALAESGVLFLNAFAHNPLTLPSHANILLGTTPLHHGVHENSLAKVSDSHQTLAEFLKARGYATAAFIGAFSLDSRFGLSQGFDVYDDSYPSRTDGLTVIPERPAQKVLGVAAGWLEKAGSPWFVWIHLWDPHAPYRAPPPFLERFPGDGYAGEVAYVDAQLGGFFDFMEANHLRENTLVLFTGDHGEAFGEHGETRHGYFAYNTTLHIPLLVSGPGIPSKKKISRNAAHIDIFPSVCDWLKTDPPTYLQGISLDPLIRGGEWKERPIYFESLEPHLHYGWAPVRGFLEGARKFIDSPLPEYYDLEKDFSESVNRIESARIPDLRSRLAGIIKDFSASHSPAEEGRMNRRTREKMRSLGYLSAPAARSGESRDPEDDLKTLLPLQQKLNTALQRLETGSTDEAVPVFREVIAARPDFGKAYVLLSRAFEAAGRVEDALDVLKAGHDANPGDYEIISSFGIGLVRVGELESGRVILESALDIMETDPDVWNHLGVALSREGNGDRALECFGKALELDSGDALIYNNLGVHHFSRFMRTRNRSSHSLAVESFQRALELDPALPAAYNGLATAYRAAGRRDDAITLWERAVELDPEYAMPLYNLGRAYLEAGDSEMALARLEKYRDLRGDRMSSDEARDIEELMRRCRRR